RWWKHRLRIQGDGTGGADPPRPRCVRNGSGPARLARPPRSGAYAAALSRRIDPELAELAVERRAADPEPARDLCHSAAIMADREADDVGLDLLERPQMPVTAVERDAGRAAEHLLAAHLAHGGREVGLAIGVARLGRDVREVLRGQRAA